MIKKVYDKFSLDKESFEKEDLMFLVGNFNDEITDLFKKEFTTELVVLEISA